MKTQPRSRSPQRLWVRLLQWSSLLVLVLCLVAVGRGCYAFRDRFPGYTVDLHLDDLRSRQEPRPLRAGFARVLINPSLSNKVWLAGFSQGRAATALHDDLWAVACVLDDGYRRLALVALDAIGFFHDDVIRLRRSVRKELRIDYLAVCSTHNHSTPDLMGLWGPHPLRSGVDPDYRRQVIAAAAEAVGQAVASLQPARAALHHIPLKPEGLLTDTRPPEVYDPDIRLLHLTHAQSGLTLGTLVNWANHPETVWSKNTQITADFCGYLRDALEEGIREEDALLVPGLGGIHLYFNGAVGGLMSTTPRVEVQDPYSGRTFQEPTHAKARALGRRLAWHIFEHLDQSSSPSTNHLPIAIHASTFELPLANKGYWLAGYLGLIDRGHSRWGHVRSELALITLGSASLACLPGEIYPELVNGGIEHPSGADYPEAAAELPVLRALMPGRTKFVMGLANDEIGYILPKSEWDVEPPHIYGRTKPPYGEVNSVGPNTASLLHEVFRELAEAAAP